MPSRRFDKQQLELLKEIAKLIKKNRETIIDTWVMALNDQRPGFIALHSGIIGLVNNFIECLVKGDVPDYIERNAKLAHIIVSVDISYEDFMDAFYSFEQGYINILRMHFSEAELGEARSTMDKLHLRTIAVLSREYFSLKDATILSMAKLMEYRDDNTGHHLERTSRYATIVAEKLGCGRQIVQSIQITCPLHDIGKVAIPDTILLKKGPLTRDEFRVMQNHTDIGAETIDSIIGEYKIMRGYLAIAKEIALYHHEKFDGTGYHGVRGEKIPMSARIFTIADIYDALASERPYKPAFSHGMTCEIITKGDRRTKPKHFDPCVLKAFMDCESEFNDVRQQFA